MDLILFSGRSNQPLSRNLASALDLHPGRCLIEDFPDGEIQIQVKEDIQGCDVYLLQSTDAPAGRNLMELLLLADACRRRGAGRITAVIPYFGYARQDRRVTDEEPVGARVVTDMLATRCDRILAVELHTPAVEGFSSVPLVHVPATPLLAEAFRTHRSERSILVAPDAGAAKLVNRYADLLQLPVAYVQKIRKSGEEVSVEAIIGNVEGRSPVIVDDMISTGGTMVKTIEALLERGALPEVAVLTGHALLVGDAGRKLAKLPIKRIITTDSVLHQGTRSLPLEVHSLAPLLADRIRELRKA